MKNNKSSPKILVFDVETSYLEGYFWNFWEQNIAPNQATVKEWSIIAFAAKWLDDNKVMYFDNRKKKDKRDDKEVVKKLRDLIDEADIILTKNGRRFDEKIFNSRCIKHKIAQPSSYQHIDVEAIARKKFKLPSYSLDYLCQYFDTPNKKSSHGKFPGLSLWIECMTGNVQAWKEMEHYNKKDVLSTEDLYKVMAPWDNSVNFQVFVEDVVLDTCSLTTCNGKLTSKGYAYTSTAKVKRMICTHCGKNYRFKQNLLSKDKKK